jgi:MoxR-like ATPase
MVGMPGTGKTSAAEQVAQVMELPFHSISVGVQTTKSDILGFVDAGGTYQTTGFREAFEKGGVFLMDEVDAGNPNVLIIINSAISNGFCNFPDGMKTAHKDFRFIATANTFGTGADVKFIGRNQLDEATLDRFITLSFEIDETLEDSLVVDKDWLEKVRLLRKDVEYNGREILVSPRVSFYGDKLIQSGFSKKQAAEMTILKGKDADTCDYITGVMSL